MNHRFIRIAGACVLALLLISCGGAESRKTKYLERGKSYLAEENYEKAAVELRNVLQIDPKHAEATFLMGEVEEKKKNLPRAFAYYTRALEIDNNYLDAQAKLGRYYLLAGNTEKATEMADTILAKHPDNIDAQLMRATILTRQNKDSEAIALVTKVIGSAPGHSEAYGLLASIYQKKGDDTKSLEILERGIQADPKSVPLRMQLARIYAERNMVDKVEAQMREIIAIEPERVQHRASLAAFLSQRGENDRAEAVLREAVAGNPKNAQRHLLLAEFLAARRSAAAAETELKAAIKVVDEPNMIRFALGKMYEKLNSNQKAEDAYQEIIDDQGTKPDGLRARNQLADLLLRQGKIDEARSLVKQVLAENARDNDALLLDGRIALSGGNAVDAINAFRSILKDQPDSAIVLGYLAQAHLANGETALARENLQKAVDMHPRDTEARLRLAQFYARTGDHNAAIRENSKVLEANPQDLAAMQMKADLLLAKKDTKAAEQVLAKIKTAYPGNPVGYFRVGQIYAAQKRYEQAVGEFEQALKLSSNALEPLDALVTTHMLMGKPDAAKALLSRVIQESPKHAGAYLLLGQVELQNNNTAAAQQAFRQARDARPNWNAPYQMLANLEMKAGNRTAALEVCQEGLRASPNDLPLMLMSASIHESDKAYDKAISVYEKILEHNPSNLVATNNLAALLIDFRSKEKDVARAQELAKKLQTSDQPAFLDTVGWVHFKAGDTDRALPILKKAVEKAPQVPVFQYHLGMVYHSKGDKESARRYLAKAVDSQVDFPGKETARATVDSLR